jgi:hypothetical protein
MGERSTAKNIPIRIGIRKVAAKCMAVSIIATAARIIRDFIIEGLCTFVSLVVISILSISI